LNIVVPEVVEAEPVEAKPKKGKAKAEKPAEASTEDVKWAMELAKSREKVFEMVNATPLADRTAWLEELGLTDVAQINEFNLEQCDELLGR